LTTAPQRFVLGDLFLLGNGWSTTLFSESIAGGSGHPRRVDTVIRLAALLITGVRSVQGEARQVHVLTQAGHLGWLGVRLGRAGVGFGQSHFVVRVC
jgi:hypothetical protein